MEELLLSSKEGKQDRGGGGRGGKPIYLGHLSKLLTQAKGFTHCI